MATTRLALEIIARNKAKRELTAFRKQTDVVKNAVRGLAGSVATLGGAAGFGLLIKSMIKSASIAEETAAKFNVVFGDLAGGARAWAKDFGDRVGRATQSVQEWMARLQDTFVPLGIARQEAAALGKSLVSLAVDVASFNNKADADVIRDFTSALVGNHETVRKYGILISESSIKQEAFRQGLNKTYSQLTDLEKVQMRYNIIQGSTTDAQGDAIRTADSYANQVKRLSANWTEFKTNIGSKVTSPLADLISDLNTIDRYLKDIREASAAIAAHKTTQKIDEHRAREIATKMYKGTTGERYIWEIPPTRPGDLISPMMEILPKDMELWDRYLKEAKDFLAKREHINAQMAQQQARGIKLIREHEGQFPGTEFAQGPSVTDREKYVEHIMRFRGKRAERDIKGEMDRLDKLEAANKAAADRISPQWEAVAHTMEYSMAGALDRMMWEAQSWEDAMLALLRDVAREITRVFISQPLTQGFMSMLGAPTTPAPAAVPVALTGSAKGDYASRPTLGFYGEAGPEAIMPLERGPGGKLGVASFGAAGGATTIVLRNESGIPLQATEPEVNDREIVVGLVMADYDGGGPMRDLLDGRRG